MSPLLSQALGSIIRWALGLIVPVLVSNGIWTADESTQYVTGASLAILALVWSLWQKYSSRIDFVKALLAPAGASEAYVKAGPTPSTSDVMGKIGPLVLVLVLVGASACTKVNPVLVSAENAVYVAVTRVDDEFRKVCTEQQLTAPCDDARPAVLELITAAKAFNRSVAAQNIDGLTGVLSAGGRLADKVKALPSGKTVQLVQSIADAVTAAAKGGK